jgi:hypothetical protein
VCRLGNESGRPAALAVIGGEGAGRHRLPPSESHSGLVDVMEVKT